MNDWICTFSLGTPLSYKSWDTIKVSTGIPLGQSCGWNRLAWQTRYPINRHFASQLAQAKPVYLPMQTTGSRLMPALSIFAMILPPEPGIESWKLESNSQKPSAPKVVFKAHIHNWLRDLLGPPLQNWKKILGSSVSTGQLHSPSLIVWGKQYGYYKPSKDLSKSLLSMEYHDRGSHHRVLIRDSLGDAVLMTGLHLWKDLCLAPESERSRSRSKCGDSQKDYLSNNCSKFPCWLCTLWWL